MINPKGETGSAVGESQEAGVPQATPPSTGNPNMSLKNLPRSFSPFGEGQKFSAADLAGLTPEMITQGLNLKMMQDQIGQKNMMDLMSIIYQQSEMENRERERLEAEERLRLEGKRTKAEVEHFEAETRRLGKPISGEEIYPIKVPEVGEVTADQWKELPMEDRSYAVYVHSAKSANQTPMSRYEWERRKPNEHIKELEQLKAHPELLKMEKELREAGAPRYTPFERTTQEEAARAQAVVKGPNFVTNVTKKLEGLSESGKEIVEWNDVKAYADKNKIDVNTARQRLTNVKVLEEMDNQIRQAFPGESVDMIDIEEAKKRGITSGWYIGGKLIVRNPYAGQ
jgi:hypothetical protein